MFAVFLEEETRITQTREDDPLVPGTDDPFLIGKAVAEPHE